ncbi:membrane protein [Kitasatospora sp. NE20-6]|uniref:rhomboid family intramembrane serine protease n=1 Tax=Kitasatospora sp. NE20-6 TaxID=2859066 RepID=UPI0034DC4149
MTRAEPVAPAPVRPGPETGSPALRVLARLAAQLRRAPVTLTLIVALWVVGAATGSLGTGPSDRLLPDVGVGLPSLEAGHWWTPVSSLLWCSGIGAYVVTTLLLAVLGPLAEVRFGTVRTAALLVAGQVAGTLLGTAVVRLGVAADIGWMQAIQDQIAVGPTIGLFAVAAVLSYRLTVLWRRRLRLLVVLVPLVMMLYVGHLQGVQRVAAVLAGLAGGALVHRRGGRRPHRASHTETRVLVALTLAAAAIGPLVASLYQDAIGPFNTLGDLYFSHVPSGGQVAAACQESAQACARARSAVRFFDSPGRLMAALAPVLLLVLAEGLRRGLRLAWWITVATELAWVAVLWWLLAIHDDDLTGGGGTGLLAELIGESLLLPVAMLVLLVLTRRSFDQRLPERVERRLAVLVGGTFVLCCAAYVGIGLLLTRQYRPHAGAAGLAAGLPAEFLPPSYDALLPDRPIAAGGGAQALEITVGVLFWAVTLVALLVAFRRPAVHTDAEDTARARALLTGTGGSTLSFLSTWDGNHYWFDEEGRAAVPYRVVATVALTTGDPFGEPGARRRAVAGFARHCDTRGWTPCFYSVTAQVQEEAEALGWRTLQVAEDTVVPLPDLAFTGKKWQDVRTSLNKAGKQGITAEWWTYREAPIAVRDQIRSISEEWVSDKGLPEMGFTLGGLAELDDPAVRLLVAVDADRTVHGLTSWMPVYEDGAPVGWTLDFMRRRAEGFRGVMEFLIASAALGFKEEGARFLSLSGAPLARAEGDGPVTPLQRMLDWMGGVLEPVYGFRSLLAFKAKFQPEYRPMYMVYPDPAALPAITRAIGKAYLPHMTPAQGVRLMRKLSE